MTISARRSATSRSRAPERGLDSLVFDLVEWVAKEPRTYAQVMEIWRTSCPRLAVWEEALDRGYLQRCRDGDGTMSVGVTAAGRAFLTSRAMRVPSHRLTERPKAGLEEDGAVWAAPGSAIDHRVCTAVSTRRPR